MDARRIFRPVAVAGAAVLLALPPLFAAQGGSPDLTQLQKTLAERLPKSKIVDIRAAPVPGLYEVFTGSSMIYSDATGNYILEGSLIDTRTKKDLTEGRLNERNAIRFDSLPLDKAITVIKGDGSRKLAVFTDPDCPYCKRLEEELKWVDNVTMYLFMLPLKEIHPNAERHAKSIWCSDDSATAWTAWVLDKKEPADKTCQNDPIDATLQLGEKLNVNGTPTLYFEDGSRAVGAMKAADLDAKMNEARRG
jgi:thiol:disulfide interchange protein DsbC